MTRARKLLPASPAIQLLGALTVARAALAEAQDALDEITAVVATLEATQQPADTTPCAVSRRPRPRSTKPPRA